MTDLEPQQQEKDLYLDTKKPDQMDKRKDQAIPQLRSVYQAIQTATGVNLLQTTTNIAEIGPGIGGVTAALNELHPSAQIIGVDRDPDERIKNSAKQNGLELVEKDVLEMSDTQLSNFIQEKNAQEIVALRTSGLVAKHMKNALERIQFGGMFIFSLVQTIEGRADAETMRSFEIDTISGKCIAIDFPHDNPRAFQETGYAFSPKITQSLNGRRFRG